MARPLSGDEPLIKKVPVMMSESENDLLEKVAGRNNKSNFGRTAINRAMNPIPVLGNVCCGTGLDVMFKEPLARLVYLEDLLPRVSGNDGSVYFLWADGNSMNRPSNPKFDIQNDDLLPFVNRDNAQNREIVHYEIADDFGDHVCGVRMYSCDQQTGIVTLRASNDAVLGNGTPLYPDIVRPRNEVIIHGVWLRISIRGVAH